MPGRSPAQAVNAFIEPLQRTLSCLSRDVLIVSSGGRNTTDRIHALTPAGGPVRLRGGRIDDFRLNIGLQYDVIRTEEVERGPFKVRTRAYDYAILDPNDRTQVSFHWHPLGRSTYHDPHFHTPPSWPGIHFPAQRTSLEEVVRLCLKEFGADPNRDDWDDVLALNEGLFRLYRSWATQPELAKEAAK